MGVRGVGELELRPQAENSSESSPGDSLVSF